jgi:hypothetical protein
MSCSHFTTLPLNRSHSSRRTTAWLGILAVLLHTGLLLSQGITAPWSRAAEEPAYLLLCSAFGPKTVPIESKKDNSNSQDSKRCPVCQLYALGKTSLPMANLLLPTASTYFAGVLLGFFDIYLSRQPFAAVPPRGPPR